MSPPPDSTSGTAMERAPSVRAPGVIELENVTREYLAGDQSVVALRDVSLSIQAGEMVAIMGTSGSGKSTLMNILGCLDRPTGGSYRAFGFDTRDLGADDLAALRREHFGFIFQRYHLLSDLTAAGNVETPAVYRREPRDERHVRAADLLARLGLADRAGHRPHQLSGGQQQRVSIARALMNGGDVILADEPTGALDSVTGEEVMDILRSLNEEGRTIILVTHEEAVASHADRIIELRDGEVVSDRRTKLLARQTADAEGPPAPEPVLRRGISFRPGQVGEALRIGVAAMRSHKLRTFLTMLGIIIGIAAVVSVVALGEGSRQQVLENISALGTNRIDVLPGSGWTDRRAAATETLTPADADALAAQPYVDSVTPGVSRNVTLRRGNISASGNANGVGAQYFRVRGSDLLEGALFTRASVDDAAQEVVIDPNTKKALFADGSDPVGQVILVGSMPAQVVGVAESPSSGRRGDSLNVFVPYSSLMVRLAGQAFVESITVRVKDGASMEEAAVSMTELLRGRHGTEDFFLYNTDEIREAITSTTRTMTILVASIAIISLIVGGIGVMNIMLVSVTERVREIGVRMAVGARRSDIMQQFLIEAVLVCLLGGTFGVMLALSLGYVFPLFWPDFQLIYSGWSIVAAFACSTLIGIGFGFLPARSAARLDPVEALARE